MKMDLNWENPPTIVEALKERAKTLADKVAYEDEKTSVTYNQLDLKSNQIANFLKLSEVKPGDGVALFFDQSVDAIAATLGVLKIGAHFIPLDIDDPEHRIKAILNDCKPKALLGIAHSLENLRDADLSETAQLNLEDSYSSPTDFDYKTDFGNELAYIFFTSGSTGTPKGVCQTHSNLIHFVQTYCNYLSIQEDDVLTLLYSLNFSASNLDIFSGLLKGATVKLYNVKARGLNELPNWLMMNRVTVLHTVPSVFRYVAKSLAKGIVFNHIRRVDLGGEPVYKSDIELIKEHFHAECEIYNHLAATEASVIAHHKIDPDGHYRHFMLPVGRGAQGVKLSVRDSKGQPAKPDELGYLIVESQYLFTGYFNKPDLTSEHLKNIGSTKEFKSGDLGFFDQDGNFYFSGRNDTRVKINGLSIDTSEVETCFNQIPNIENTVVKAVRNLDGSSDELACFVKLMEAVEESEESLRKQVLQWLPRYMLPKHLLILDTFPLTATGKIDRKALTIKHGRRMKIANQELEIDNIRTTVTNIYAAALRLEEPKSEFSFFELGGDSLGLMDVVTTLETTYNVKFPMRLLTNDSSINNIVAFISKNRHSTAEVNSESNLELISELNPDLPYIFLVHGRNGHSFIGPQLIDPLTSKFNVFCFRARGFLPGERPGLNIQGIAADYISEMKAVQSKGPYFVAGICAGGVIAVEIARQLQKQLDRVGPVMAIDPPVRAESDLTSQQYKTRLNQLYKLLANPSHPALDNITRRVKNRAEKGFIKDIANAPNQEMATQRVYTGLEIAVLTHTGRPFKGKILVIASEDRAKAREQKGDTLLKGDITVFRAGKGHTNMLDPNNERFKHVFEKCLTNISDRYHKARDARKL